MIISILIYIFFSFSSVMFALISERIKALRNLGIVISLLFIVVLCGLRYNVGTDYESYVSIFDKITIDGFVIIEPGYYLLNELFKNISNGQVYVFFICTLITYVILYLTLLRENILFLGLFFSFTFGFVFLSNNIIRQALVIPLFFYSIKYIYEKRIINYWLCIIVCSLFHYSAILLIPLFWIYKLNFKKYYWLLILSICYLVSFTQIFKIFIIKITSFLPKYSGYLISGAEDNSAIKSGTTMFIVYLLNVFIIYNYKYIFSNEKLKIYYNLYLLGVSISFLTMNISFIFRFSYYLTSLIVFVLPLFIKSIKIRDQKLLFSIVILVISLIFWSKALWFNDHGCLPYNSLVL